MSKLTDIIRREVKDIVTKQGGLMVTPAVVTAVQEDYLRADVRLMGNGAEIKGMLNKSPGKLTVGQTVTVAYSTLPSSGVILIANGETDPLSEGGGWEVETAAVLDAENVHQWIAQEELMADINANTKLLYGGHPRLVMVNGVVCRLGSQTLTADDLQYFGRKFTLPIKWRGETGVAGQQYDDITYTVELNAGSVSYSNGSYLYYFDLVRTPSGPGSAGTLVPQIGRTYTTFTDPIDVFIVPTLSTVDFRTSYSTTYGGVTWTASTPYGYVPFNNFTITVGAIDSNGNIVLRGTSSSGSAIPITSIDGYTRSCIPLGNQAENYFDKGVVRRSVPVEVNP